MSRTTMPKLIQRYVSCLRAQATILEYQFLLCTSLTRRTLHYSLFIVSDSIQDILFLACPGDSIYVHGCCLYTLLHTEHNLRTLLSSQI